MFYACNIYEFANTFVFGHCVVPAYWYYIYVRQDADSTGWKLIHAVAARCSFAFELKRQKFDCNARIFLFPQQFTRCKRTSLKNIDTCFFASLYNNIYFMYDCTVCIFCDCHFKYFRCQRQSYGRYNDGHSCYQYVIEMKIIDLSLSLYSKSVRYDSSELMRSI